MINKNGRFILFCLLTFLFLIPDTQASKSDSLRQVLSTAIADTTRVNVLNALSKAYCNDNPDTAVTIGASSRDLAEKIKFKPTCSCIKTNGHCLISSGKYIDAVNHWQQALEVYKSIETKLELPNMLSNQGAVYFNQGDDAKFSATTSSVVKMSEKLNDTLRCDFTYEYWHQST
ncbi:MAG: tetratricopeptide repeat protein [Anaerolineales bacterium]|nr:tetratricopeptide repeat protein [Anaerolineales bacterium]